MDSRYILFVFAILLNACTDQSATIREINQSFTTYGFSNPDRVPRPDRNYYPYFRYDEYAKDSELKEWKVVEMENSYVKVHILPEIGGKIWGAIEKSTGNEFLYYNSVVKFRNIGMRGPWTSGGIEFNFGIIGHSPHVSTPVDYLVKENDDGSVSCFIGGIDLLTRARWETEVNLQPDKAYFTTNTKYSNTTPLLQPYYQWSNAAYQSEGGLTMSFPGNYRIGHGGEADPWPISEDGKDLTIYENNAYGGDKSYHITGAAEGYFAAYYNDIDFGAGHFSNYGDKLGKKIWLWSHARSGRIWEDLLTDEDGQYVELQSGRLFNQASTRSTRTPYKHFGFVPYALDEFEEYWYPVMNIGGVVNANQLGALNVVKRNSDQTILFSPLHSLNDEIYVYFGNELKQTYKVNLKPLEVWQQEIEVNPEKEPLKIVIGANQGLIYSEENNIVNRPVESPEDFDWNSVYGLYTDGVNWIYQGNYDRAFQSLEACLAIEPNYAPALNHLAELYIRKADYGNALNSVVKSLSIDTYDPKANFIYGYINRLTNNLVDARDGFAVASISPEYRAAAHLELAKLFILKGQINLAHEYAERVLKLDGNNQEALLLLAVASRKADNKDDADEYLGRLEELSPLNHFSRAEKMFAGDNRQSRENFISLVRNELPYQTFLEMALWYQYLGYNAEAIAILEQSPENALVNLQLAYLHQNLNREKSEQYFNAFIDNSTDFVFPFRHEMFPVLDWAVKKSDNWKPKYYLGLLQWSTGNSEIARDLFVTIGDSPQSPYFYLARNELFNADKSYNAEGDLKKAFELGSDDWRTSLAVIDYYLGKNRTAEALEASKKSLEMFPASDALKYTYAKSLLANGLYSESLNELENTVILPHEGARHGRITYRQAAVMESLQQYRDNNFAGAVKTIEKARLWPENLGVGRPFDVDERIEDFLEAEYSLKLNGKEKANALYQEIIDYTKDRSRRFNSTDYLYLVVLKRLGETRQMEEFLSQWEKRSPKDPVLRWSRAMLRNNRSAAQQIEKEIDTGSEGTPWDPRYSDSEFELIKAIANNISS